MSDSVTSSNMKHASLYVDIMWTFHIFYIQNNIGLLSQQNKKKHNKINTVYIVIKISIANEITTILFILLIFRCLSIPWFIAYIYLDLFI